MAVLFRWSWVGRLSVVVVVLFLFPSQAKVESNVAEVIVAIVAAGLVVIVFISGPGWLGDEAEVGEGGCCRWRYELPR